MLQSFPLVRLAALDLDGTLLNRNNEVTLATRQAIARAVEHGVVVVPATGRPLASHPVCHHLQRCRRVGPWR